MSRPLFLNIANFICRFGEEKVLLDLLREVVVPAFVEQRERKTKGSTYVFDSVKLVQLGKPESPYPAIMGRIVKLTTLHRDQIYEKGTGIIPAELSFPSAPSSIFALLLTGHKLLYVREHPGSPSLKEFESTAASFIRDAYEEFVTNLYGDAKQQAIRVTKKAIKDEFPPPTVEVIEISSSESLNEFVARYDKLTSVSVTLVMTNNTLDDDPFFAEMRRRQGKKNSTKSILTDQNPKGLDKEQVLEQLQPATDGNARIMMNGVDKAGDKLQGTNEKFRLSVPLGQIEGNIRTFVSHMFESFEGVLKRKLLKPDTVDARSLPTLEQARETFKD
jgi:hypothetical protein